MLVSQVVVTPIVIELHHGPNRMTVVTPDSLVRVRRTSRVVHVESDRAAESPNGHIWYVKDSRR